MTAATSQASLQLDVAVRALADTDGLDSSRGGASRDIHLARRLATVPSDAWGPAAHDAYELVRRHAAFLLERGVDVEAIAPPDGAPAGEGAVRAVFERDGQIVIAFSYDRAVWESVKALPNRHYDRDSKEWTVPGTREGAEAVVGLLGSHAGFTVAPDTSTLLRRLLAGEEVAAGARRAEPHDARFWRLYLPKPVSTRDWALLAALRRLDGARFFRWRDGEPAHWRIDMRVDGALDSFAELLAAHPEISLTDDARRALARPSAAASEPAPARPARRGTAGALKANAKTFSIATSDVALIAAVKQIAGATHDAKSKRWRVPRQPSASLALEALIRDFDVDLDDQAADAIAAAAANERIRQSNAHILPALSRAKALPPDAAERILGPALDGFAKTLHPFQEIVPVYPRLGVRNIFLTDSMGLGKTVEALAAVYAGRGFPCIVVCSARHRLMWRKEIGEAIPTASVAIARGQKPDATAIADADFVIVGSDVAAYWLDALIAREFLAFVADESHYFANAGTKKDGEIKGTRRTWAATELAADVRSRQGLVLCLTGTPLKNGRARELIAQLEILGELDRVTAGLPAPPGRPHATAQQKFLWRFADPQPHSFAAGGYAYDGASNEIEMHELLRSTCLIRRHKNEVLDQLPPKQRVTVPLEISASALANYRSAQRDIVAFLREHRGRAAELNALTAGLSREAARAAAARAASDAGEKARRAPALVAMNTLRRLLVDAKVPGVIEWTQDFLAGGEKLILFAVHQNVQAALVAAFAGCAHIVSGDSEAAIEDNKARFQADPDCRLMVASLGIAREGHTLTAAANVAFCELDWAPLALEQAEDRAYGRMNDLHGATCHYLLGVAPEEWADFRTVDEIMAERIDAKRRVNAAATDGARADEVLGDSILGGVLERLVGPSA